MNRFVSLLLIPIFMLGQGLPHSHAGTGVLEPDDHASRPHVHLSVGHSHHHGDDHDHADHEHNDDTVTSEANSHGNTSYSLPREHDDDAIYVGQNIASVARSTAPFSVDFGDFGYADEYQREQLAFSPKILRLSSPDRYAGLPIYLLVASLRL
jgi:hypothetical protein